MSETTDLPGFDDSVPSTWHPMHRHVTGALHGVTGMLGVRLGTNLAPAAEYIARALWPGVIGTETPTVLIDGATRPGGVLSVHGGPAWVPVADWRAAVEEIERLRGSARHALLEVADRLAGEDIPYQPGCVQFIRDVAEEYPGGVHSGQAEWELENEDMRRQIAELTTERDDAAGDLDVLRVDLALRDAEVSTLRRLLAEVLPYVAAGADALDHWEPYGGAKGSEYDRIQAGAAAMLARLPEIRRETGR